MILIYRKQKFTVKITFSDHTTIITNFKAIS